MMPALQRHRVDHIHRRNRGGMALLITLVVLVVLTTLVYTTTSRMALIKHRQQYLVNYQTARYACDTGMKLAFKKLAEMDIEYIEREHQPDFSHLFTLNQEELNEYLGEWAIYESERRADEWEEEEPGYEEETDGKQKLKKWEQPNLNSSDNYFDDDFDFGYGDNSSDPNSKGYGGGEQNDLLTIDPNKLVVPGPYGAPWPEVMEPIEFELGNATITIRIEDEEAKLPLVWGLNVDAKYKRPSGDAIEGYCEWMQMNSDEIGDLQGQLEMVADTKTFLPNMKAIVTIVKQKVPVKASAARGRGRPRPSTKTVSRKTTRPANMHSVDFSRLLHSSVVDLEALALPIPETGDRYESSLKYLGIWGSQKVNINSAPAHVLESAFKYGGDEVDIAREIIDIRKKAPIKDIGELEDTLNFYGESIRKCLPFITTNSSFFTITVTAYSGSAKASLIGLATKKGNKVETIAIFSAL
jgi:hypothetical protein